MKLIGKILSLLLPIALIVALLLFGAPRLFGVKMFNVISGSMRPTYEIGDLVYAVPTKAEKIKDGDVITFVLGESLKVATHRVVKADIENQQYYTKGDANSNEDGAPVLYQNVVGVVRFSLPKVGGVLEYAGTPTGRIISITALIALIFLTMILNIGAGSDEAEPEEASPNNKPDKRKAAGMPVRRGQAPPREQPSLREPPHKPEPSRGKEADAMGIRRGPPPGWGTGKANKNAALPEKQPTGGRSLQRGKKTMLLSLALIVTLGVAATLTYLTTRTSPLINDFDLGNATVVIDEPGVPKDNVPWGADTKPVQLANPPLSQDPKAVPGVVRALLVPVTVASDGKTTEPLAGAKISQPVGNQMDLGDYILNFDSNWSNNWVFCPDDGYFYYKKVLHPGQTTEKLLRGVVAKPGLAMGTNKLEIEVLSDILQTMGAQEEWPVNVVGEDVSLK